MKRERKIKSVYLLLIAILLSWGCKKDDVSNNTVTVSQIIVSPDNIMINDNETSTLSISVQPPGEFQWDVASKPDWIEITPSSGTINNSIIELELTPNSAGLNQGKHFGEIDIITNGAGKVEIYVELCVDAHPIASVEPTQLIFSEIETEKNLIISNVGTGFLNWEVQSLPAWLSVNIQSGILDEGEQIEIVATAQRNGLEIGTFEEQAVLNSNSEEGAINIDISLQVPANAIMSVSESSLNYGYFEDNQSFFIKNEGNINFDWSVDNNSNSFISASPSSGSLSTGDSVEVTMMLDRTDLISQTYDLELVINNNEGQSNILPVQVNHFQEEKWLINGRVIDAEYDRNNDMIIVVSETPNELRKFNPSTNSIESIALNIPPTCISVGLDGNYAAVGHNGSFSYINLSTMELEDTYAVTADAFDIILAPNEWVYVFPEEDQWERIRCINLSNGVETEHTGNFIRERTKVKLHPSGDKIYGANNGVIPSDFEKYNISNGTAEYLYDSPYHGDFSFSGDIWISEDGNRLFAKSRNVFNASTNQANDMAYNGELAGEGKIITLDYSSTAQRIYAVFTTGNTWDEIPSNEIRKYETDFLGFQGTVELPGFLIPDGNGDGNFYESQGHFGYFSSDGMKYYVLVKVEEGAGAQNEWAIVTIDVE